MLNKFIAGLLIYTLAITQVIAQTATLVPNAKQTFLGTTGTPLAAGTVTYYVPGSTNKKTTWLDAYQASANTNPVVLDSAGRGVMFGQGNYRQVVKDKNGVQIWDSFTSAVGSSAPSGATGTDTAPVGTIVPYAGFTLPTNWQLAYGQAVSRTTFSDLKTAITIVDTAVSCTNSSTTLSGFTSTAQMRVGAPIEATCISTGITIATIAGPTSITVSSAASATSVVTATVFPWGNGDGVNTFNVPDLRGRIIPGADAMGGTAASRLTTTYYGAVASAPAVAGGSQSRTIAQNQLPNVTLALTGTLTSTSTVSDVLRNPANVNTDSTGTLFGVGSGTNTGFAITSTGSLSSGATASLNGNVTQSALATIQPSLTINYMIKMAPNSTGAGGVVSIGGMFGDIVCDATFNCSPQGSPSVNTIGLASQATLTMLANITGGSTQPTGTTNTAWLDATCGSADGMIPMRNTTWGCLTPGTAGYALVSQGPGLPLHWLPTTGIGTVTSVGLALPSIFTISGSPVTGAGTLAGTLATQIANTHFAGPASGGAAIPTFRALVSADIPPINLASTSNGGVTGLLPNANLANASTTVNGTTCTLGSTCTVSGSSGFYTLQFVSGAWTCRKPDSTTVSVAGSTTSGLQECINAYQAAPSAGHFRAICAPTQTISVSTGVTFGPAGWNYYYDLRGCYFSSSVTGSTVAINIDTFSLGSKLDWSNGFIQVSGGSPTDSIIQFFPATANPTTGDRYTQDATLLFPYVLNGTGNARSTMAHCVHFVPGSTNVSGFNNNTIQFQAIDGGSTHSACSQLFAVDNPSGGTGNDFVQNLITIPLLQNPGTIGMVICSGGGSGSNPCATNTYNVSITTSQTGVTACVDTWGFRDTWNINSCSINAGTLNAGFIFETGADKNWLIAQQLNGTAPFTNNGSNNHGVHDGTQF